MQNRNLARHEPDWETRFSQTVTIDRYYGKFSIEVFSLDVIVIFDTHLLVSMQRMLLVIDTRSKAGCFNAHMGNNDKKHTKMFIIFQ